MSELTEIEWALLASLEAGPKVLDMGRSPVQAITIAWDFADRGLVHLTGGGGISLTEAGRQALRPTTKEPRDA